MIIVGGLACSRGESPSATFDHVYKTFLRGKLKQAQDEAHRAGERFQPSAPDWAWKFRILEAQSLLWQGMYIEVLALLNSQPTAPGNKDSMIELLAIRGVALARLHQFAEAENDLGQAQQMCKAFPEASCGDVLRARGVLAVQRGLIDNAKEFFGQSLQFARAHNDPFLEETALLNLGLTSLREGHFDEAIDWTDAAYRASTTLGAAGEAQAAMGNLGWAYYNLGDSEKSLELSLEASNRAVQAGDVIDQLYWTTNVGYVRAQLGDLARAKESYLQALDLSTKINGREGIYNAQRALALVSVESGELDEARKYSEQAIALAQADNNRLNELYPLLVKGLIAAQSNDGPEAERIFREVDHDKNANAALKWRSEHALARLYEDEDHLDASDREYRAALATFESARSSLQRNESKLPFSNNASRIYDDYVHFLVARGKTDDALRWADYSRARTLAEGLGLLAADAPARPATLDARSIARRANGTVLFYWLGKKQSYLWAVTPRRTSLFTLPPALEIDAAVQRYRKTLTGPQDVLAARDPDGRWLWNTLVAPAQSFFKQSTLQKDAEVVVIPDGSLNTLNFETLLVSEPTNSATSPHFWIEDATISSASSLRVLGAAQPGTGKTGKKKDARDRSLLLIGNSVAPNRKYPELPGAAKQAESVARHFPADMQRVFTREQATPDAFLKGGPENFSYIHFVAHGTASRLSPLDSAIVLSNIATSEAGTNGESFKLYARDIMRHPLRADLVTISACYGAGERAYSGEGLVGLSWAFLWAGAHNVVAALWEASDASTVQLMDKFYDELDKGVSPNAALRTAKLSLLRSQGFHNPFYWAPFQLYTGSGRSSDVRRAGRELR